VTLDLGEIGNTFHFEEVKRARTAAQDDRRKLTQKLRAKQIVRGSRIADQTALHCVTEVINTPYAMLVDEPGCRRECSAVMCNLFRAHAQRRNGQNFFFAPYHLLTTGSGLATL